MAKSKTQNTKSGPARTKVKSPMRDIKAKTVPRDVFTIHQLKPEEGPTVEPLVEENYSEENVMEINKLESGIDYQPARPPRMSVTAVEDEEEAPLKIQPMIEQEPKDTIKVKFGKFVQLVSNHDFTDVIETHAEDEIVMSSNLLTDLAGASDKKEERKIPLVFLIGIVIGVVLTYIFFSQ
jgi:hypothetical protein